jgi:hypothetical protein
VSLAAHIILITVRVLQASQLGGNKQGNGTVEYSTPKVPLLL